MTFSLVTVKSILSNNRRVVRSASPMPSALPWEASLKSLAMMYLIFGLSGSGDPAILRRPIIFVSIPVPLKFFPISSTISTSISSAGSLGIKDFGQLQQRFLACRDFPGRYRLDNRRLVIRILNDRHAEQNFRFLQNHPADFGHQIAYAVYTVTVQQLRLLVFADPDRTHFHQSALPTVRRHEIGMGFDPAEHDYTIA